MIHLTPAIIEATYELLLTTLPFRRWRLPSADDIEFRVGVSPTWIGLYEREGDKHWLHVSVHFGGSLNDLVRVMAHELIHIHLFETCPRDRNPHNRRFRDLAARVCTRHGFDFAQF